MVRPAPRYQELLIKRGLQVAPENLETLAKRFATQDLLDLQVWHNLAWFGYGALHRFPHLVEIRKKGRGFSEQDKADVLELQFAVMREVVPSYRKLAARGQVELITSPLYHPILPLLIDTEIARRSLPHLPALPQIKAAADAEAQIRKAVEYHQRVFGEAPKGLWPSEGSV
jgi:alpha-amylase/alpha-mannosidase (GH57 family)